MLATDFNVLLSVKGVVCISDAFLFGVSLCSFQSCKLLYAFVICLCICCIVCFCRRFLGIFMRFSFICLRVCVCVCVCVFVHSCIFFVRFRLCVFCSLSCFVCRCILCAVPWACVGALSFVFFLCAVAVFVGFHLHFNQQIKRRWHADDIVNAKTSLILQIYEEPLAICTCIAWARLNLHTDGKTTTNCLQMPQA